MVQYQNLVCLLLQRPSIDGRSSMGFVLTDGLLACNVDTFWR